MNKSMTENENAYDPYRKADLNDAQKHRQARRVRQMAKALKSEVEKCKCCGFPVYADPFPLSCDMTELSGLGSGFPLYFVFSKTVSWILFFGICIAGLPCLIGNILADESSYWSGDKDSWLVRASLGGNGANSIYPFWQCVLHVVFMFWILVFYHIGRRWFESKEREYDIMAITARDYTVHAHGLGNDVDEKEVKEFFEQFGRFDQKPAKVVKVVFAYKIKEYIDNLRKLEELGETLKKMEELENEGKQLSDGCCHRNLVNRDVVKGKMERINIDIKKFEDDLPAGVGRDLLTGQAFVTFETQADARAVAIKYGQAFIYRMWQGVFNTACCCFTGKKLEKFRNKVISAPIANEPNDIFWENLEVTYSQLLLKSIYTWIFTFFTLSITFGMIFGTKYLGNKVKGEYNASSQDDTWKIRIISIWPSIVIVIINFILSRSTRFTTSFEKPHNVTAFNISVATKLMLAMFFNTALIPLIVHYNWKSDWFEPGGLVSDVTYIFISNALVSPIIYFLSPVVCLHKLKMKRVEKADYISQHDANLIFENPPVDMAQRFANLSKTVLLTFCYAPLIPLGLFFGLVAVWFEYWMFKFLLLRRHSWPSNMSGELAMAMFNIIPWSVLLYSVNNYVYMQYLNPNQSDLAFVWMLIIIGYNFFPIEIFTGLCIKKDVSIWEKTSPEKYEDVALTFLDDYDKLNPITAGEGHKRFANLMLKKNVVDKGMFKELKKDIKKNNADMLSNMRQYAKARPNAGALSGGSNAVGKQSINLKVDSGADKEKTETDNKIAVNMHKIAMQQVTPVFRNTQKDVNNQVYPINPAIRDTRAQGFSDPAGQDRGFQSQDRIIDRKAGETRTSGNILIEGDGQRIYSQENRSFVGLNSPPQMNNYNQPFYVNQNYQNIQPMYPSYDYNYYYNNRNRW